MIFCVIAALALGACSRSQDSEAIKAKADAAVAKAELAQAKAEAEATAAKAEAEIAKLKADAAQARAAAADAKSKKSAAGSEESAVANGKDKQSILDKVASVGDFHISFGEEKNMVPVDRTAMLGAFPIGARYNFSQSTGTFGIENNKQELAKGFSGEGEGRNNPSYQSRNHGPIPVGRYVISPLRTDFTPDTVKWLVLTPDKGGNTYGRKGSFVIIPDDKADMVAEQFGGVIYLPRKVCAAILWHGDNFSVTVVP